VHFPCEASALFGFLAILFGSRHSLKGHAPLDGLYADGGDSDQYYFLENSSADCPLLSASALETFGRNPKVEDQ
jgi:hypothetical protein